MLLYGVNNLCGAVTRPETGELGTPLYFLRQEPHIPAGEAATYISWAKLPDSLSNLPAAARHYAAASQWDADVDIGRAYAESSTSTW